jgi:PAS domain S-box-containing protein
MTVYPVMAQRTADPAKPHILLLNSYHNGLRWSDEIVRGIRDALEASPGEPELFVEYMDTKRFLDDDYLSLLFAAYRYKYRNAAFDLIISSDDNAYRFLLAHKDDLFPGAPWVFCGVNHYKEGDLAGRNDATGVVEILNRADTIDVSLRLFPEARHVLVVTDRTTSGIGNREKLEALSSRYEGRADFVFLDDAETRLDLDRLVEKINAVSVPSVVYFSDFFRDAGGRFFSMETVMTTLSGETPYPIFPTSSPYLRWGAFGGRLVDGFRQGRTAGGLALEILGGADPADMPVIETSVNPYMFNKRQLLRFGVSESALPPGSIVVNRPFSFYRTYRHLVLGVSAVVIGMALMILFLFLNIGLRRRAETSLREREAALRESEERFRLVFREAPVGIAITDPGGRFLAVNDYLLKALQYAFEELTSATFMDITHPDDRDKTADLVEAVRSGQTDVYELQKRYVKKDGTALWCRIRATAVRTDDGAIRHWIGTIEDISEKRRRERQMERLHQALESTTEGVGISDENGRVIFLNKALMRMSGYDVEGLDRAGGLPVLYKEDKAAREAIDAAFADRTWTGELTLIHRDGETLPIEASAAPIRDATGNVIGGIGIHRDISERKTAEAELRRSEEKYRELYQQAPVMLHTIDPEGRLLEVNEQWLKTMGYTREEVIGRRAHDFLTEESKQRQQDEVIPRFHADGFVRDEAFQAVTRNGAIIDVLATAFSKTDADGAPTPYTVSIRDITEYKRAEEERARLERQVVRSQKMEAIGRLAGGVAHDLNNLLTPILGYAELLLIESEGADHRTEPLEQIINACTRARDLVRQLLAFGRKQTLEYKPLNINQILADLEKLLRRTIREDVHLTIVPSSRVRIIMGDPGQIEQVVMNLAVNAADAMPDGGELTIETLPVELDEEYALTHAEVTPGEHILLAVSDTGHGMDDKVRSQIFEPFFTTKGKGGTGLGLATAYGIVKQHGGNIWVYSEPGRGTTFKVYLPASGSIDIQKRVLENRRTDLKGAETILLAEDDLLVREIAADLLVRQGYTVLSAKNGMEALEILGGHGGEIDLLLTDVVMPEMNGKELYSKVAEKHAAIRVLYMSGYTDNVIAHHGVLDEGVDFIQKPFTIRALAEKVREVIDS